MPPTKACLKINDNVSPRVICDQNTTDDKIFNLKKNTLITASYGKVMFSQPHTHTHTGICLLTGRGDNIKCIMG